MTKLRQVRYVVTNLPSKLLPPGDYKCKIIGGEMDQQGYVVYIEILDHVLDVSICYYGGKNERQQIALMRGTRS